MDYYPLDVKTVAPFLESQGAMQEIFSDFQNLDVFEIGDGNLNFVFRVSHRQNPKETVIVKQAIPYVRLVGESWPLTRNRIHFENMALQEYNRLCPEHVPIVFLASREMSIIVMEHLQQHKILRGEIIAGKTFPKFADHISTFLAKTLFYTSDLYLDHKTKKERVGQFINVELCKITEDLVFTAPYEPHESNVYNPKLTPKDLAKIQENGELKIAVAEMKYKFMNNAEAMIHGDLHIGSIMVNENETYVIDPEFVFYGPMGFDVGAVLGNLLMSYFSHEYRQKRLGNEPSLYRGWLLETIVNVWNEFSTQFDQLWKEHQSKNQDLAWNYEKGQQDFEQRRNMFLNHIFADAMGFGACKMMRRVLGLAKVEDIAGIADLEERARIERMTLELASHMVIHRNKILTIEALVEAAKAISPLH